MDLGRAEVALLKRAGSNRKRLRNRGEARGARGGLGFVQLGLAIQVKPHALLIVGHGDQPPAQQSVHGPFFGQGLGGWEGPSPDDVGLRGLGPHLSGSEDLSANAAVALWGSAPNLSLLPKLPDL